MTKVRCVLDARCQLAEGPVWDEERGVLYWVDIPMPSSVHALNPESGQHQSWPMPEMATALALWDRDHLLVACHRSLRRLNLETGESQVIAEVEPDRPQNRCNDGGTDPKGRFWFGTMQNNIAEDGSDLPLTETSGAIYCFDTDRRIERIEDGLSISNTFVWSPDQQWFYTADTPTGRIFAYRYDSATGKLSDPRLFAEIEGLGLPDGSTIDSEGYLWNARWGGGCIVRFAPDGTIDRTVDIPATKVTSCAFGGDDLSTLFVTTARQGLDETRLEKEPQAGGLFAFEPGVTGLPERKFAGR